jgi:hypothetical protein
VLTTFEQLYRNFQLERSAIPPQQIIDVRYEDLARDPLRIIARIYDHFGWNRFADVEPLMKARKTSGHHRRYELPPGREAALAARWREYSTRHGYSGRNEPAHEVGMIQADVGIPAASES